MSTNLTRSSAISGTGVSRARIIIAALAILMIASLAPAQQRPSSSSSSSNRSNQQNDATSVFRSARDLITDGEWAKAQEKFNEYVNAYPNEKNIDAALYWLAYTQQKLAKYDQCRATLDRLLTKYPNTSWKDDARVLMAQVPGAYTMAEQYWIDPANARVVTALENIYVDPARMAPVAVTPQPMPGVAIAAPAAPVVWGSDNDDDATSNDPCEFKIVVLQALFQTDLQRGIMAATEWLKPGSTQTVRCKGAALALLGRNGGKTVTPVILSFARSEPDLKLRARAIAALGASNDDSVVDALRDFALNSQENDIVEASLYALSKHTGERAITVLSDIAISGKVLAQRKMAIASIASRPGEPAVDALFRIYDADQSVDLRKAVIAGFGNRKSERAGTRLVEIARSSDNVELRKVAISAISRRGGDKAVEFLLALYETEKNEELKDQILNSLGYGSGVYVTTPPAYGSAQTIGFNGTSKMNDQRVVRKLIEIARNPKEPMERRRRAIGWLSRSKDPQVLPFLEELLK